jgi:hypothetical protein
MATSMAQGRWYKHNESTIRGTIAVVVVVVVTLV